MTISHSFLHPSVWWFVIIAVQLFVIIPIKRGRVVMRIRESPEQTSMGNVMFNEPIGDRRGRIVWKSHLHGTSAITSAPITNTSMCVWKLTSVP